MKKIFLLLLFVSPVFSQQIVGHEPLVGTRINWAHPLSRGLVGLWLFNEGSGDRVYDLSGNGSDGALTNMNPESDWIPGRDGFALDFDGVNQYVDIVATIGMVSAISVSAWFKVTAFDIGWQAIVVKGETSQWRLQRKANTNTLEFDGIGNSSVVGNVDVNDGLWHHVVAVHGTSRLELYIDGVLDNSASPGTIQPQEIGPFDIGRNPDQTARVWEGSIDDVRIYSRALTSQEILSLYINPYSMFEQPLYGRRLKAAVAGGASGPGRLPQIIKIESEKKFFVKDSLYALDGNRKQTLR